MADDISVAQMKIEDRDAVLMFLRTAYPGDARHGRGDHWDWHFPDSPRCKKEDLPIWLAWSKDRIVGQLAATPVEFNINGRAVDAIWILDLIVHPEFRRLGIAGKLALASKEYCPYVLGINTTAQHSTELLAGLGWSIFTRIPRYQRVLFPGSAVKETAGVAVLREGLNAVFHPLRPSDAALRQAAESVRPVEDIGPVFDHLWQDARTQWRCSISRDAAMVEWQFRRQPRKRFEILGCFDEDERLKGYVAVFHRRPDPRGVIAKSAISDICYHPDNAAATVDALIAAVLRGAIERRVGSVVTDIIDPLVTERLKAARFRTVPSKLQLLANVPETDQNVVYDAANWFLTRGDSDISIFEDPNVDE